MGQGTFGILVAITKLSSKLFIPTYMATNNIWELQFLHIFSAKYFIKHLDIC